MRNINNITIKFNIFSNITNKRNNNSISIKKNYIVTSNFNKKKITKNPNLLTKKITIIKLYNKKNSETTIIPKIFIYQIYFFLKI